jgi:hypothetical protein
MSKNNREEREREERRGWMETVVHTMSMSRAEKGG